MLPESRLLSRSDRDLYGRHLRKVVKHYEALPLCEHRRVCKCKRCRKRPVDQRA